MRSKKVLILSAIIILVLFIIIDIILIFITSNKENNENNYINKSNNIYNVNNTNEDYIMLSEDDKLADKEIEQIKDNTTFYTIENCIKKFESFVNLDYTKQVDELGYPSLAAEYKIYNQKEKQEAILKFLDKEYINQNNINASNVLTLVDATMTENTVEALKINKLISNNTQVSAYSVCAKKTNNGNEKYVYYIVKTGIGDVFSIYPIKTNNIDDIKITNTTEYIEPNERNTFLKSSINESQIATKYFQEYKSLLLDNPNKAYEKLDEEYRNKRFGSVDEFKKYISDNKKNIELMQIYRYGIEEYNNYNEYIARDRYDNIYIFNEKAPKDYAVLLDNYTIETEEYKKSYNSATDEGKAKTNANKFISMINNKDYKNAYALLNTTFKNNNYNTLDKFTSLIKDKMFDINKVESNEVSENGEYYVCDIELSDYKGESNNNVSIQIIVKLGEETNFELSFSFIY